MSHLTKDQILSADDRDTQEVDVPEWGGTVLVQEPTSWDLSQLRNEEFRVQVGTDGKPRTTIDTTGHDARLAAICIVDEEGKRLFSDKEVKKLGRKSQKALDRVLKAIRDFDGVDLEEIEGNSEPTDSDTGSST